MNVEIFIVTFQRDFHWLTYCLQSLVKYASGFSGVTVAVPYEDFDGLWKLVLGFRSAMKFPITVMPYEDWPEKPMLRHEWAIFDSDNCCPQADLILHVDSDCVFFEPVTPDTYFIGGKPVLMYCSFEWVCRRDKHEMYMFWKTAVEQAIGGTCDRETMRRHGALHYVDVYAKTRSLIREHTGESPNNYVRAGKDTFPQSIAEFPTLGEVAWRHFRNGYHWINQETDPHPLDPLIQFWSHGPMDKSQNVQVRGVYQQAVPAQFIKQALS